MRSQAVCSQQPLSQTDISPSEDQLLDWIVKAVQSNRFSFAQEAGEDCVLHRAFQDTQSQAQTSAMHPAAAGGAYLQTQVKAGAFAIDLRFAMTAAAILPVSTAMLC